MQHPPIRQLGSCARLPLRILLISTAILSSAALQAQGLASLSDYLVRAQSENPGIQAFQQRYEAAKERIPQVAAFPDPMLQVTHFVESVQTRTGPQENIIMLNQRIPWFGQLSTREKAASARAEALWYAFQEQQLKLVRLVSHAFYEYGYIEKAIALSEENLELLQNLEPIVQTRVEAGGDLNPLLRLKVEMGRIEDRMRSLEQQRISQSARLQALLGTGQTALLPWPDWEAPEAVTLDGSPLMTAIERNNPHLRQLERMVASAEARRDLARLEGYPDLTIGVNYIQIGEPEVNPMTPDAGQDPWGVSLAVNIPLWRGKYTAAKAEALAGQRALENEYEDRLNALRAELSSSMAALNDANRRLNLYGEELLGLARQAVENSRSSYEGGRTGILEVIDSERSLLDLQLAYWRAAADAWQERVLIQTLANQPILETISVTEDHD